MKIKAVCEETGLTDRTIRYYIEEDLISPQYTENYLGRKTFNFTRGNIEELKHIATLRSFDFSVEEIRSIIQDSASSSAVIRIVKERIRKTVSDGEKKLNVLRKLDSDEEYTIANLAKRLVDLSADTLPQSIDDQRKIYKTVFSVIKSVLIFLIVWFPIILSIFILLQVRIRRYYPVYNFEGMVTLLLCWLPSFGVIVISKFRFSWRKIVKIILLVMCMVSVPFCFVFSMFDDIIYSQTKDIRNYRNFDVGCHLNTDIYFNGLFPQYAHTFEEERGENGKTQHIDDDAKYFYRYTDGLDFSVDVYAEWTLKEDAFFQEITRVENFFKQQESGYTVMQYGKYNCYILEGYYNKDEPFCSVTDSYHYLIFAYNEEDKSVRYIFSYSLQDGAVQPYYLSLNWN